MSKSEERRIRKERKLQERLAAGRRRSVGRLATRSCRICGQPFPEAIQRHILEHREPGEPTDRPGILVQYNCASCPEVVAKLTRIVEGYPKGVYFAPYPRMSPRIALVLGAHG